MPKPTFAKLSVKRTLKFGDYMPNNKLLVWLSSQDYSYKYEHHKCELFLNHKTGWMVFQNNAALKHTLYLAILVVDKKNNGHGTKHMEMLKKFTDETGVPISLICFPIMSSDPDRLRRFYTNLGFKEKDRFFIYEKMEAIKKDNQT